MKHLWILAVAVSVGCSSGTPTVDSDKPHGTWTALQDLQGDALMIVGPAADAGRWREVAQSAKTQQFKDAVNRFVSEPLPAELEQHKDLKDRVDEALNNIVAAASSGGRADEMEASWKQYKESIRALKDKIENPSAE